MYTVKFYPRELRLLYLGRMELNVSKHDFDFILVRYKNTAA